MYVNKKNVGVSANSVSLRMVKKEQFRASGKLCVYCGEHSGHTRDHVPPKGIFFTPLESSLITVPACEQCNSGFSALDTKFKEWLAFSLGTQTDNRLRYWNEKLLPMLQKNNRRQAELIAAMKPAHLLFPEHNVPKDMHALPFEASTQRQMIRRLVKGLWFKEFQEILPPHVAIQPLLLESFDGLEEAFMKCTWKQIGEQFSYGYGVAEDQPASCWFFTFHGGNLSAAFTGAVASNDEDE